MRNPLTWLFGFSDTPNPDVIGIVRLTNEHVPAERLAEHARKLREAKAYMHERRIAIRPTYIARPQKEAA